MQIKTHADVTSHPLGCLPLKKGKEITNVGQEVEKFGNPWALLLGMLRW